MRFSFSPHTPLQTLNPTHIKNLNISGSLLRFLHNKDVAKENSRTVVSHTKCVSKVFRTLNDQPAQQSDRSVRV